MILDDAFRLQLYTLPSHFCNNFLVRRQFNQALLMDTMDHQWIQYDHKSIWSFAAMDFLDFDFSQLKVKHPSVRQL